MSPSGLLLELYSADHVTAPTSFAIAQSSLEQKPLDIAVLGADPEHTNPNTSHIAISETMAKGTEESKVASSSLSFNPQQTSAIPTHVTTPFLEMEDEDEHDRDECYHDALLEDIPLNDIGVGEDTMPSAAFPLLNREVALEKEEKEDGHLLLASSSSSSSSLSPVHSKSIDATETSCGKRQRNSRRVSFPSPVKWSTVLSANKSTSEAEQDFVASKKQRYTNKSLVQIRYTIHLSEYTPEERLATWYTFADLKSFKRERKETARRIDNGLLSLPLSAVEENSSRNAKQTVQSDIYVDYASFSIPIVYCSRGVENCTMAMSRTRYRHIAAGWKAVISTQDNHRYRQRKLASMSSKEQDQYNVLASFLGVGRNKTSRKTTFDWLSKRTNGSGDSPRSSFVKPSYEICCPYKMAAAYQASSLASLKIARQRAIGDELDLAARCAQDLKEHMKSKTKLHTKHKTVVSSQNSNTSALAPTTTVAIASTSTSTSTPRDTDLEQKENQLENQLKNQRKVEKCDVRIRNGIDERIKREGRWRIMDV